MEQIALIEDIKESWAKRSWVIPFVLIAVSIWVVIDIIKKRSR